MADWHCHVGGTQYGPVSEQELRNWIAQGRLRPTDNVWTEGMAQWIPAQSVPSLFPPGAGMAVAAPAAQMYLRPHRGGAVLALGIVGIVLCGICGIIAWVMGSNDLKEIRAGRMDRAGEGITQAGKICGIIGTIIGCLQLAWITIWLVAFMSLGAWM